MNSKILILSLFLGNGLCITGSDWHNNAIWYQIFPERFHNGDPSNDPTIESLNGTWPWEKQKEWQISPWTSDWYAFQPWELKNEQDFRYQFQIRRYGGDIQGIIDKLDYLQELGINAIYLNPVFDSPSSHKYGAATYHHIDRHFGPDPEGDARIMASEIPNDPKTWKWTAADQIFLSLVQKVHDRGMYLIIDGVFNHAGLTFWAFQDVIKHKVKSEYFDWFVIDGAHHKDASHGNQFQDLPELYSNTYGQLRYKGWVADLPSFRQDEMGPVEPVREYFKQVVHRWMDPNNDGDPSDGIDGWRLDVAERVQIGFWSLFGKWVKTINPDAYITGEIWWEDWWNNKMFDASPWLVQNRFDGVMNYRFGDAMYKFFINQSDQISPSQLDKNLASVRETYPSGTPYRLQNLMGSHDTERLASATVNPDRWIDHDNNTWYNRGFKIRKPNQEEQRLQKAILLFQFTYVGAPFIYYGDEAGMWGADDPDCRKPMVWPDFKYESETAHFCDFLDDCQGKRLTDSVYFHKDLFSYYQTLCHLRTKIPALTVGAYKTVLSDDKNGIFIFERSLKGEKYWTVFNSSDHFIPNALINIPNLTIDNLDLILASVTTSNTFELAGHSGKLFKLKK